MSISSHIQLLGEDSEDCDQVVYESIDDYIDMQTFERNVQPSPYVDPTVTHSPVYSNTTAVLSNHAPTIAVTPSSQHAHPRPRVGPKPQLKEVLLKPYPPSTPPPDTCPSKKVAKNKPVVFKAAKQALPKTPPIQKRPPVKQYTQLSLAAAHPPAPHDYESLRPRARQQVMKRYSRSQPQDKQGTLIPLQDLYDDGQQTKRLSSVSKEGVTEDEDSEGTHADSPRVVCLLLTITIVALLIAVAGFIATMYSVTSVEKLKAASGELMRKRGCVHEVMHECNSSEGVNANTRVVCPLEIKAVEFNRESITCEATYIPQIGQEVTPSNLFVATVMKYSQNGSTYIQCACFFIPNIAHPVQPSTPPPITPPITHPITNETSNSSFQQPPPTMMFDSEFEAILSCTMIKATHCTV